MYVVIFSFAYLLSFVCLFLWARAGNSRAVKRLRRLGANEKKIGDLRCNAAPLSLLIPPTLILGTFLGAIVSVVFWGRSV